MYNDSCENNQMKTLVSETFNFAVLDSGCTTTVCGLDWYNNYLASLDEAKYSLICETPSSTWFKFGDGVKVQSLKKVKLPCVIAQTECLINADVVSCDIPLLLSKVSMKKAKMHLNLADDTLTVFGKDISLHCTTTGHYCLPLIPCLKKNAINVLLTMDGSEDKHKVALKLHKQFAHPSAKRLKLLFSDAGIRDSEYDTLIEDITENCDVCMKYKKTPPRPIVSLPLARDFNEVVAMDLKEWDKGKNVWILHLIDLATRFSISTVIHKKESQVIVDKILEKWIGTGLGCPKKFLADNGGEFANENFKDMAENLNITVLHTAAESPFSNGLCERNHAIIDDMVRKILADHPNYSLSVALSWAVHAKNSLQMVEGFSPYQLVFGRNPTLPSVVNDELPALEGTTICANFAKHINALHSSRQAFIKAESEERIRRALRHNVRKNAEFVNNGDFVYYKRENSNEWKGPGKVVGCDGKIILVKHGSNMYRVHDSRITKCKYDLHAQDKVCENESSSNMTKINYNDVANASPSVNPIFDHESDDAEETNTCASTQQCESKAKELPKVGMTVRYLPVGESVWKECVILSRAGKVTGKYKNWLNIQSDEGEQSIDWSRAVQEWKLKDDENEYENQTNETYVVNVRHDEKKVRDAKLKEIESWKQYNVYDVVTDKGQPHISVRWVCTEKALPDGNNQVKARLVARGFEEHNCDVQTDSPTAGKETLRIFLSVLAMFSWICHSIDVKAAFLQGANFDRDLYLKPPKEAEDMEGRLWKLNKCVYGLNDASRVWYFTVRDLLLKLGCKQLQVDPSMFQWYFQGSLCGIFLMHVDDFIWGGTHDFEESVIKEILKTFDIGRQANTMFKYIGLGIKQDEAGISLSQNVYLDSVNTIPISYGRSVLKDDILNDDETRMLRSVIGQINWMSTQTRPDICFDVLELSNSLKQPTVSDILKANKCVKKLRNETCIVQFPCLDMSSDFSLDVFCDASHANLPDGFSSAEGYIIFLTDNAGRCCPLAWGSKKIRRVVKSSLAAETLSLVDAIDVAMYLKHILSEVLQSDDIAIRCHVDNKSLWDNVHSTKSVSEKRLRIDMASIKEMLHTKEIKSIHWTPASGQLADCFTKRGACCGKLLNIINTGHLDV